MRVKVQFLRSMWDRYSYFEKATTEPFALAWHQAFSGAVAVELNTFALCFKFDLFLCTKLFEGSEQPWLSLGIVTNSLQ